MSLHRQFSTFFVVGLICAALHYAVMGGLKELAHWPVIPSTLSGFCVGGVTSYVLNRRHTFASDRPHAEAGWRFVMVTTVGFFLTWLMMSVLMHWATTNALAALFGDKFYLVAQAVTTGTVMFWNFGANRMWTFRARPPEAGGEVGVRELESPRPGLPPRRAAWIAGALVFVDSLLGQLATFPNLVPWYASLIKPAFTPPNTIFGSVWTLLYALMALAFWRILILPEQKGRKLAIILFLVQLALNVLWSYAFFAGRSPLLGLIDIGPQLLLVAAAWLAFRRLDRLAGLCLLPLVFWVGFAAALNFEIWRLNG